MFLKRLKGLFQFQSDSIVGMTVFEYLRTQSYQ